MMRHLREFFAPTAGARASEDWLRKYWSHPSIGERFELALPSIITFAGLASGIYFVAGGSVLFAGFSLLADFLDGVTARALCAQSTFGARFDYMTDVVLAVLYLTALVGSSWLLLVLVPFWACAFAKAHFSGRLALMVILAIARITGHA